MRHRRQPAERPGVVNKNVEPAEPLENARPDRINLPAFMQVERKQGRRSANRADRVVRLLETSLRTGRNNQVRAEFGQLDRDRGTNAAARARNHCDFAA